MKKLLKTFLLAVCLLVGGTNSTWAQVIYSWEGGTPSATETGGTAVASDGSSVNFANTANSADYKTIRLNGNKDFSDKTVTITLSGNTLQAGDIIRVTGYRNKDVESSTSGFKAKFGNGNDNVASSSGTEFNNIYSSGLPNTCTFNVPFSAVGSSTITMTRSHHGTNFFITKIQIVRATVKETYDFKTMIAAGYSDAKTSPSQSITYYLYGQSTTTTETNCAKLNYLYNASANQYSIGTHIYMFAHASNADLSNTNYWWIREGDSYNILYNNKTNQNQRFALVGLSKGDKFTITFSTGSLAFQTANVYPETDGTKTNVTASSTVDDCTSVVSGQTYVVSDDALGEDGSINVAMVTKKAAVGISKIVIERTSIIETITAPTINVAYNGAKRTVTIINGETNSLNSGITTYYTTDGSTPTTSSNVYSAPLDISTNCTIKAISKAVNGTVSSVTSQEVTVGKLAVASPTIALTGMAAHGKYYSPQYKIENGDNSGIFGTPAPTLSATFNGESVDISSGYYVPSTAGTLIVTASADKYTSSSTEQHVYDGEYTCLSTPNFNEITLTDLATTLGGTWGDSYNSRWSEWTKGAGKKADLTNGDSGNNNYAMSNLSSGGSVSVDSWFTYTRNRGSSTLTVVAGFGLGEKDYNSTMTIKSPVEGSIVEFSYGKNTPTVYYVNMTADNETAGKWERSMESANVLRYCKYYKSEILAAIADCKAYETSAAFATHIEDKYDAGDLKTAAAVYAAHSAWQIAQAQASGSTDYSKAIMNRTFELHNTNGWTITGDAATGGTDSDNNGVVEYGEGWSQYYTGWNGRNVSQNIAGLPAGTYRLTAKVYSWNGGAPVRLFANGQLSTAENGDDHDPVLDFTVTGNEASIKIGIGGVGNNNDTDNTWGIWGYRVKNFTLTKLTAGVTVGKNGYTTFASPYALDLTDENRPEGLKAYKATLSGSSLSFQQLHETVAAGTGLLLLGETNDGTYNIPVLGSGNNVETALTGVLTPTPKQSDKNGDYYFVMRKANSAEDALSFAPITTEYEVTIPAGKVYVTVPSSAFGGGARAIAVSFDDDETTGIDNLTPALSEGEGVVYNLNGQRIDKPAKGLYIVNGKKVLVK